MGYKVKSKIRVDLGELGDNNGVPFFAEVKNPKMLTYDQAMEFTKIQSIEDEQEKMKEMKTILQKNLIVSWNLIDLETEEPVNLNDTNALNRVPLEAITAIIKSFAPKEDDVSKNSSEQSVKS